MGAVACGCNGAGKCDLPALEGDLTYVQAAAGGTHTVLLRSDGTAVACGLNGDGQCDLPALRSWPRFLENPGSYPRYPAAKIILQSFFDGAALRLQKLSGEEVCQIRAVSTDRLADVHTKVLNQLGRGSNVDVVLPGGAVLGTVISQEPLALLGPFLTA